MAIKANYRYGPPVTRVVATGTAQNNSSAVTLVINGGSNHTDGGAATTQNVVTGSPSDESGASHTSTITSTTPSTIAAGAANALVTVTGTDFTDDSAITLSGNVLVTNYVSATSLTATFPHSTQTAGAKPVRVQTGAKISATTVNFTYT